MHVVSATVKSIILINSDDKQVRYKIAIISYHYAKHRSKPKNVLLYLKSSV